MLNLDTIYINKIKENSLTVTRERKAAGLKVVGVYCAFTPKELILAGGGVPVSLCGSSNKPIPMAEKHLPRNMCPLIKSSYGFALGNTCPFFDLADFLIADATCDGKKKMYELMNKIKPIHVLQLPNTSNGDNALKTWVLELYRFKAHLEEQFGTEITKERLHSIIRLYNRYRKAKCDIFELNKEKTPLLTGREIATAISSGGLEIDIPGHISRMRKVIDFAQKRGGVGKGPRILLTGCPTTSKKVLNIIEESATVVAMENCGGLKSLIEPVSETGDPIIALAKKYLAIACPCMSPNHRRFELISSLAIDYNVAFAQNHYDKDNLTKNL